MVEVTFVEAATTQEKRSLIEVRQNENGDVIAKCPITLEELRSLKGRLGEQELSEAGFHLAGDSPYPPLSKEEIWNLFRCLSFIELVAKKARDIPDMSEAEENFLVGDADPP